MGRADPVAVEVVKAAYRPRRPAHVAAARDELAEPVIDVGGRLAV
jgi:hypothetical protein